MSGINKAGTSAMTALLQLQTGPRSDGFTPKEGEGEWVTELDVEDVRPDTEHPQPRLRIPSETLEELAASILESGVIQPIVVRPDPDFEGKFFIIAGERRWKASKMCGRQKIPVLIKLGTLSHLDIFQIQVSENLFNEPMTDYEEAMSVHRLIDEFGLSNSQIRKCIPRSKTFISELTSIAKGPSELVELLKEGTAKKRTVLELIKGWNVDQSFVAQQLSAKRKSGESLSLEWASSVRRMAESSGEEVNDNVDTGLSTEQGSKADVVPPLDTDTGQIAESTAAVLQSGNDELVQQESDSELSSNEREESFEDEENHLAKSPQKAQITAQDTVCTMPLDGFKKRSKSQAVIHVDTPKGTGEVKLDYLSSNPLEFMVELNSGDVVSVPFNECTIIGYE